MSPVRQTVLAMGAYVLGLVLLFGSAFVFLSGLAPGDAGGASEVVEEPQPHRPATGLLTSP